MLLCITCTYFFSYSQQIYWQCYNNAVSIMNIFFVAFLILSFSSNLSANENWTSGGTHKPFSVKVWTWRHLSLETQETCQSCVMFCTSQTTSENVFRMSQSNSGKFIFLSVYVMNLVFSLCFVLCYVHNSKGVNLLTWELNYHQTDCVRDDHSLHNWKIHKLMCKTNGSDYKLSYERRRRRPAQVEIVN